MHYKIHSIPEEDDNGKSLYCGPSVFCALTGKTPEQIYRAVNRTRPYHSGVEAVESMWGHEVQPILKRLGLHPKEFRPDNRTTLRRLAEDMEFVPKPFAVLVTGHFVLLYKGKIYDSLTREGCPFIEHPSKKQKVQRYWEINKRWKS